MPFDVPLDDAQCAACLTHPPAFDRARAILRYDDVSRVPILALKHADRLDLVPGFGQWLERAGRELLASSDLIVPVPLYRTRLWRRRYNQAAELARNLSRRTGLPLDTAALVRSRPTPSQGAMPSAKARRRNVMGAFQVPKRESVTGRHILLVDDVLTTGATAEAAARALRRAGAAGVQILALARVVRAAEMPI
jgi:ComF family protein